MKCFINGLSKGELRQIKISITQLMLILNKDLKKAINECDYDEIKINIECLDDYSRLLDKIAYNIQYRIEKK